MDSTPDHKLIDNFSVILGGLILLSFVIIVTAVLISRHSSVMNQQQDPSFRQVLEERIRPIGDAIISGHDTTLYGREAGESIAATASLLPTENSNTPAQASFTTGEEVYNSACTACHTLGIAGAPKLGDAAQWTQRISTGAELLYDHAINGYTGTAGIMPAKGGRIDLTDEQVKWSVDYMVEQSQ